MVFVLLAAGNWIFTVNTPNNWSYINEQYVRGLGTEVGGAGLDALLVGAVAGFVATRLQRWRDESDHRGSIARRRARQLHLKLSLELERSTGDLPLWGQQFEADTISDKSLRRTQFSQNGELSARFIGVTFDGCDLKSVCFRGCKFIDVKFTGSVLRNCDFRGATFQTTKGIEPFRGSIVSGCKFDGTIFDGVNLNDVENVGCTFWKAEVRNARLPKNIFEGLGPDSTTDLPKDAGYRVIDFWSYVGNPNLLRLSFVLKTIFAYQTTDEP